MAPSLVPLCALFGPPGVDTPAFDPGAHLRPLPGPLADHEAMDGVTHAVTSAHFAVKWGDLGGPTVAQAELALQRLEQAYALQVVDLALAEPAGMSIARMNVYVVGTGITANGAPLVLPEAAVGVAAIDPDGWPMFLLHPDLWTLDAEGAAAGAWGDGDWLATVLAHEFHHTVQLVEDVFRDERWFVEGTANWAAERQVPHHPMTWMSAGALRDRPEVAFAAPGPSPDQFDPDDLAGHLHPYGTFTLPVRLEEVGGDELVVSWLSDEGGAPTAFDHLADLLSARALRLDAELTSLWAQLVAGELGPMPAPEPDAHLPSFALARGQSGRPPADRRPGRFGANVVSLDPGGRPARLTLRPDRQGDRGTPATWGVATVNCRAEVCVSEVLAVGVWGGTWTVDPGDAERLDLVVVPASPIERPDERFDYTLALGDPPTPEPRGCDTSGAGAAAPLWGWWLWSLRRRARR